MLSRFLSFLVSQTWVPSTRKPTPHSLRLNKVTSPRPPCANPRTHWHSLMSLDKQKGHLALTFRNLGLTGFTAAGSLGSLLNVFLWMEEVLSGFTFPGIIVNQPFSILRPPFCEQERQLQSAGFQITMSCADYPCFDWGSQWAPLFHCGDGITCMANM